MATFVTIHRRVSDPLNESWHAEIELQMRRQFGAVRTLWNSAWIEFEIDPKHASDAERYFEARGHGVTVENADAPPPSPRDDKSEEK